MICGVSVEAFMARRELRMRRQLSRVVPVEDVRAGIE